MDLILRLAREHEALITVEEGAVGGFGAFVLQALAEHGALDRGLKVRTLTLPDIFQDHDKPDAMYAEAGLDAEGIVRGALAALGVGNAVGGGPARLATCSSRRTVGVGPLRRAGSRGGPRREKPSSGARKAGEDRVIRRNGGVEGLVAIPGAPAGNPGRPPARTQD